jgi:hypothetical protein
MRERAMPFTKPTYPKREEYFVASESGLNRSSLRWGASQGRWTNVDGVVYKWGNEPVTDYDRACAVVIRSSGVAGGPLAGVMLGLDTVVLHVDSAVAFALGHRRVRVRRRAIADNHIVQVKGFRCTDGFQTIIDLAAELDDAEWEQALESALRMKLFNLADLIAALPELGRHRTPAIARIRRVLSRRLPIGAPPTESLLETLMVQVARQIPNLGPPTRQLNVFDAAGIWVARVDLAWPELGLFIELDGQQHIDQPVYDANRETRVVAATGWLCGRFTWHEVRRTPKDAGRRLERVADQARRRPIAAT